MTQPNHAHARLYLLLRDYDRTLRRQGDEAHADEILKEANTVLRTTRRDVQPAAQIATEGEDWEAVEKLNWIRLILECLAGELSPDELVEGADVQNPARLCEGYYYAGEACLLKHQLDDAREWFQRCGDTDLPFDPDIGADYSLSPMNEYYLAHWRLKQLAGDTGRAAGGQ